MTNAFECRWRRLWDELGKPAPPGLLAALLDAWREPQRAYHTLQHLDECLAHFEAVRPLAQDPAAVELALWFHDAVYDVRVHDNEARSADWARRSLLDAGLAPALAGSVAALVLATRHDALPASPDAQLLTDIDLAILGASPARFAEYERQIRAEYAHVPPALFSDKRRQVLRHFLAREPLYQTRHFRQAFEARARANLSAAVATAVAT